MEKDIRLNYTALELLNHPYITPKMGNNNGSYCIRLSDDVKISEKKEYDLKSFAKCIGVKFPTKTQLKKWRQLTDDNCHTEVLIEIVKWAKENTWNDTINNCIEALDEMNGLLNNFGHNIIPMNQYLIHNVLLKEIKHDFGYTTYQMIHDCL